MNAVTIEPVALDASNPWPVLKPLPPELAPVKSFDIEALPAALRPFVEDTTGRMGCPVEFPAIAAMIAAGACLGRGLAIRPKLADSWHEFGNLWGVAIGSPASMKSPALSEVLGPLRQQEIEARKEWEPIYQEWQRTFTRHEIEKKAVAGAMQREAAAAYKSGEPANLGALPEPPPEPVCPRLLVNDATTEKLVEIAIGNSRGLLLDKDELSGWLASFQKAGREADRAFFLETASGKTALTVDRIGRGTIHAPPIALSVVAGIQPGPIRRLVDDAAGGIGDDGLLQRFGLLVWPDSPGVYRMNDSMPDRAARIRFADTLWHLRQLNSENVNVGTIDEFAPGIPFLRFEPEAGECFARWNEAIINRLRADDTGGPFGAHLMKLAGKTIPALALICECCDSPRPVAVGMDALARALLWAEILESHARRLYAPALSPEVAAARRLGRKIAGKELDSMFTQRNIYRKGWEGLTGPEEVAGACDLLARLGWLRIVDTPDGTPGRPSDRWEVNPGVFERDE